MKTQGLLTFAVLTALMTAACGGGSGERLGGDSRLGRSEDTVIAPEDTKVDVANTNDEVILPSAPAATPEADPIPASPSPAPESIDEPGAAFSLHIDAEKKTETRLGLVTLSWTATGKIDELYLWSEGFNRFPGDKGTNDPCGPISDASMGATRYLLVNSIDGPNLGYDLNDGSPAHTALLPYLDSAQLCDSSICEGFSESAGTPPACRIDLDLSQPVTFSTRALAKDTVYHLCAKTAEGTTCGASDVIAAPQVSFGDVSAALNPEGRVRFTLDYAYALRAAKVPQGCVESATSIYDDRDRGRGTLVADCPLSMPEGRSLQKAVVQEASGSELSLQQRTPTRFFLQGPSFSAAGIGNTAYESFHIAAQDPVVTVNGPYGFQGKDGCLLENSCEGTVKIKARVSREVTVTRAVSVTPLISGKTTAGIDWVHLQHNDDLILPDGKTDDGLPKTKTIKQYESAGTEAVAATAGEGEATFTGVARNHKHYRWRARVSVDGKKFDSHPVSMPYAPSLTITQTSTALIWGAPYHDGGILNVTAHHMKDIGGECRSSYGAGGYASYSIHHPGWGYATSTEGTLHPTVLIAQDDASNPLTCRFWGVSHDGQVVDGGSFHWSAPAAPPPPPEEEEGGCFPVPYPPFVMCN